jgi:hypothetical protein
MNIAQVKKDFDSGVLISRATLGQLIDYAMAHEDAMAVRRGLVRELDVLLNGEAEQASLCDIVAQVRSLIVAPINPTDRILNILAGCNYKTLSPSKQAAELRAYEDLLNEFIHLRRPRTIVL